MDRWQNKVAVVTGASSGIGAAIAIALVNNGLRVIGLARRCERVEALRKDLAADKQDHLTAIKCDVSDLKSITEAFDQIIAEFGGVDVLVNNAGCFRNGQLSTMNVSDIQQVLQTNVMGAVYCTQRAFKSMKERAFNGHVVLINSVTGHKIPNIPGDGLNIYAPSKYALRAMTEIYRQEFNGLDTKIKVTSISPGFVDTEIVPDGANKLLGDAMLRPEDISSGVLYAISTPPHVQIHEMIIKPVGEIM